MNLTEDFQNRNRKKRYKRCAKILQTSEDPNKESVLPQKTLGVDPSKDLTMGVGARGILSGVLKVE